jgi:glyoxylase-like metal-dependent hydrolase (beta-lactamase superfamily II)
MIFKPYYYDATGCAAYLFGCGGKGFCAVVDPHEEDVEAYAAFATQKGMRITHIIDTHVQADHRSGGRALAARTGARYCLHASAEVGFPFEPLQDGQVLELGNTIIRVLHTPGPASTMATERRWNRLLSLSREDFVRELTKNVPAKPAESEAIIRFNQGRGP